ncbi:MAG: Mur ligase domain-containing protein, partial [Thermodesulfobacteriota bacterium]
MTVEDLCLLTGARLISGQGQGKVVVTGVTYDSRQVQSGDLFVAVPGFEADGRRFIAPAIAKGAVAVLGKSLAGFTSTGAVLLEVDDVREAMAKAACAVYGYPNRELTLFGITGTNGKTTTAYLLRSILEKAGKKSGLLGTVEYITGPAAQTAARTTPESP